MTHIFVDGACSGNPGMGGYGVIIRQGGSERTLSGAVQHTTNNQMELMGAVVALEQLDPNIVKVKITSDSQYLVMGASEWVRAWAKKGWRTQNRKPVANRQLWQRLLDASRGRHIEWEWVRGHNGHAENERCDAMAREAIANMLYA